MHRHARCLPDADPAADAFSDTPYSNEQRGGAGALLPVFVRLRVLAQWDFSAGAENGKQQPPLHD
jgi:hypothetical protein